MACSVFSHNVNVLSQLQSGDALVETLTVNAQGYLVAGAPFTQKSSEPSLFSRVFKKEKNPLQETVNKTCKQLFDTIIANSAIPLDSQSSSLSPQRTKVKQVLKGVANLGKHILAPQLKADLKELVQSPETLEARLAIRQGIEPKPLNQTISGTYVMHNRKGHPWGIFKPMRQEVGGDKNPSWIVWAACSAEQWNIESGTGYLRECAAYQLDKEHFSQVPLTVPTHFKHAAIDTSVLPIFTPNFVGSFQLFKKNCDPLAVTLKPYEYVVLQPGNWFVTAVNRLYVFAFRCFFTLGLSHISTEQIHKMAILDIRILNCDRHLNNCLIERKTGTLYPIDHGLILPGKAHRLRFEWRHLIQSRFPFSHKSLRYIENLDPQADAKILEQAGIAADAIERMKLSSMLLKAAACRGLTLHQIAHLMEQVDAGSQNTYFEGVICRRVLINKENPQLVINQAIDHYLN